jgi:4-diphosphocytidyl-2-C-methyl-D-erythritol kinase
MPRPLGPGSVGPGVPAPFAAAPAKINLVLEVVGRRADGFHDLRSVFAPLVLADALRVSVRTQGPSPAPRRSVAAGDPRTRGAIPLEIGVTAVSGNADRMEPSADTDGSRATLDRLTVSGAPDVPATDNLVLRAAQLLRVEAGRPLPPLAFRLRKRIPAAAGLGGGSSDALTALDLAADAWGLRLSRRRRLDLAAALGSDVPFFALGGWALVSGRGERLVPLPPPRGGPLGVLLVVPSARLATRDVFAAFDDASTRRRADRAGDAEAVARSGAASRLATLLRRGAAVAEVSDAPPANDLLDVAAALLPGLDRLRRQLGDMLGRPVHLSGSGPTLFVLYASPRDGRRAAREVLAAAAAGMLRPPGGTLQAIATATEGGDA